MTPEEQYNRWLRQSADQMTSEQPAAAFREMVLTQNEISVLRERLAFAEKARDGWKQTAFERYEEMVRLRGALSVLQGENEELRRLSESYKLLGDLT